MGTWSAINGLVDIDITDDMMDAGGRVLERLRDVLDDDVLAVEVYIAMKNAAPSDRFDLNTMIRWSGEWGQDSVARKVQW